MKNFILGIILGIALIFTPFIHYTTNKVLTPCWQADYQHLNLVEPAIVQPKNTNNEIIAITTPTNISFFDEAGNLISQKELQEYKKIALSKNNRYFINYGKLGKTVDLYDFQLRPYWAVKSAKYPYISYNGELTLLLISDQTGVKILDKNANNIGVKNISGRLCTSISFAEQNDFAGIGFFDGNYYFINKKGNIINKGKFEIGTIIKNTAISSNGLYNVIHAGNNKSDFLLLQDLTKEKEVKIPLEEIHLAKSGLNLTSTGESIIIDNNAVKIFSKKGKLLAKINTPKLQLGYKSVTTNKDFIAVSLPLISDECQVIVLNKNNKKIILNKKYPERFVDLSLRKNSLFIVKGMQHLYCYKFD